MKFSYNTRTRLRAIYHSMKLLSAGIKGDIDNIADYIAVAGEADCIRVKHVGEKYDGQIVYLIHEAGEGNGFFAEFKFLLDNLIYADKYGLVPCVRFGKDYLYYDEDTLDTTNPFEYYFEPIGAELEPEKAQNLVISNHTIAWGIEYKDNPNSDYYHMSEKLTYQMVNVLKKYIFIKAEIIAEFDAKFNGLISNESDSVLGVHYRGTDFKPGYVNHPTAVTLEQLKLEIDRGIKSCRFDRIFLATDDENAYQLLKNEYGEKLLSCDDVKRSSSNISVAFSEDKRDRHHFRLGLEVLRDMYFLSKCDGLICGLSQVSSVAHLYKMSRDEEYRYYHVIDNGINQNGKQFCKTIE